MVDILFRLKYVEVLVSKCDVSADTQVCPVIKGCGVGCVCVCVCVWGGGGGGGLWWFPFVIVPRTGVIWVYWSTFRGVIIHDLK